MKVQLKKFTDTAILPSRGSDSAAGYDLSADISSDVIIKPHETKLIGTGISVAIPDGYFGGIYARSGLSLREGLRPANCTGVIDSDYRGEIKVSLHNDSNEARTISPQERIAQLVIMPYLEVTFDEVSELNDTIRGTGGFGSTG